MGGKSQKQTSYSSVGPPEYISNAYQNIVGQAQNTAAQPFQPYTGQLVAGLTPEQQAGIAGVTNAQGAWSPFYNQAAGLYGQSAQSVAPTAFSADAVAKYMNPFQQQVIDATLAQTAENDRRQQSDLTGQAIQAGAWGGDRAGVAKAELARQQKLAADQTVAGLNAQNYNQGLAAFQQQQGVDLASRQADAARAAAAAQGLTGLGGTTQDSALKDAMAQIEAGGVQQQNTQQGLSSDYQQWLQQQSYPFESLGWLANILTGVGAGAGSTSTGMSKTQGGAGGIAGALTAGLGLISKIPGISDERVKSDVEEVGRTHDGQAIYRYRLAGDPEMKIGLMAQEVEGAHPEAVGRYGPLKTVDYEAATDDAVRDGFAGGGGVAGIPYAIPVQRRIPELNPIKGRTGLMAPPAAPSGKQDSGGSSQDLSKLGSQLGGLAGKAFGEGGIFGSSTGSFDANTPRFDFQSGLQLFGPGFADGGAVPSDTVDMERGADGVYRPGYAFGGDIDFFSPIPISIQNETNPPSEEEEGPAIIPAWRSSRPGGNPLHVSETEAETQRLERALGMVQTPADREALIRTVFGEAANQGPVGQRAVGATIKNRAVESGLPPADVVLQKGQFEPWMTDAGRSRMLSMSPVAYSEVSRNLAPVFANEDDPTGGATHFYAPKAQAALGRNAPRWDDGSGVDIGDHRFFNIGYGGEPSSSGVAGARPVTATAYAPEESRGIATDAFQGVSAGSGVAAPLKVVKEAQEAKSQGLISPELGDALIAAGLAMMASRSPNVLGAIGEGGLAGLNFYQAQAAARRKEAEDAKDKARKQLTEDRDFSLRSRTADNADKSLLQRAQEAKERLGLTERQIAETERHNKAGEEKSKFSAIPGTGTDADGNQVPGTYVFDQGTGEMKFQPGMVAGARKDPEADLQRKAEFHRLKTLNDDAEAARTVKGSVANLRELRKGVSYSGVPGAKAAAPVAGMFGYGGGQALESAATNFKLDLSSKLKGAISDKEQAMLQSATPGLGMSDQAANQVLDTYEGVSERAIERNKFYQAWRARNKSLVGADDAWDRYVQENPVVSSAPNGALALNRKNLGNWQRYIGTPSKPAAPDASSGAQPSAPPEAKRVSKEEYDALPAGAPYIAAGDPSNSIRYKGGKPARADGGEVGGGGQGDNLGPEKPQQAPNLPDYTVNASGAPKPQPVTFSDDKGLSIPLPSMPYTGQLSAVAGPTQTLSLLNGKWGLQ